MSDFLSGAWGIYIAAATLLSILACVLLAWGVSRGEVASSGEEGVETTGHVWDDDLEELNNPLPRWWLYLFYMTCIFAFMYLLLYPGLGQFIGAFGWSSARQYEREVVAAKNVYEPLFQQFVATDIQDVAKDPEALAMGQRLFLSYCAQCHSSDAQGGPSFPNLTDGDWLGDGSPEYIKATILNGRNAMMPPMLAGIGGTEKDATALAHYVLSLSGTDHDAVLASEGEAKFAVCAACHGAEGNGNQMLGAPDLTDDIWLHGGSLDHVIQAITLGINNQMPAFDELLGEGKAHVLSAYVWSLSMNDSTVVRDTEQSE